MLAKCGIPDVVGVCNGHFFAWELKKNYVPTTLQKYVLNRIDMAGGIARIVTPDNLDSCIKELTKIASL